MKFLPLIWAGLWRKKPRTVFTLLAIIAAFVVFGALGSVDAGFRHVLAMSRYDRLFTDARYGDARFGRTMPLNYLEQIRKVPGVQLVAPVDRLVGTYQTPKNFVIIGMSTADFFRARSELVVTPEQLAAFETTRTGVLLTEPLAVRLGVKLGDRLPIQSTTTQMDGSKVWTFDVVGLIHNTDQPEAATAYGNYTYFQEARSTEKNTTFRFITLIDDPHNATRIAETIDDLFTNSDPPTRTISEREQSEAGLQSLGDMNFFFDAVALAVLFMLAFLTGNTMMESARERIPEFAVLKAVGYSDLGVLAIVIAECLIPCLIGAAIGLAIGLEVFPRLKLGLGIPFVTWSVVATGFGAALAVALTSSAIPAWRVRRLSVVDAFARR